MDSGEKWKFIFGGKWLWPIILVFSKHFIGLQRFEHEVSLESKTQIS